MKKGAFQLSLGFIVVVVFAVILLSLALAWIQGIFQQLTPLTYEVTNVAKQELLNKIAQSGSKVGIAAPDVIAWKRGETGSYALGIKNKYPDMSQTFCINIYLDQVGGALLSENPDGDPSSSLKQAAAGWLTYSKKEVVDAGDSITSDIVIKPDIGADVGIYMFRIAVCEASSTGSCGAICDLDSSLLYGTAQFTLEIEGV